MIEKPYDGLRLKILIPTKKNWFIIIFLMAWTGGWYMGESSAIKELLSSKNIAADSFTIFWLIGWTVGGLFAITILVWSLFGWELIYIDSGIFKVEKGILNLRLIRKSYDLHSIKDLNLNAETIGSDFFGPKKSIGDFWGLTGGKLKFDYGLKTIKFGNGIDEAEAKHLIDEIKRRGYYKDN